MAQTPQWMAFESLIAEIHRQLAPGGTVIHNSKVRGRSGAMRQLDVAITQTVGLTELLIVIECKKIKRSVGIAHVDALASKVRDVGASKGVLVSTSGFQEGAIGAAKDNNILLLSYREAEGADWDRLLGASSWKPFVFQGLTPIECLVFVHGMDEPVALPGTTKVVTEGDEQPLTLQGLVNRLLTAAPHDQALASGTVYFDCDLSDCEVAVEVDGQCVRMTRLRIQAEYVAKRYYAHVRLARGEVLESGAEERPVYARLYSHGLRWRDMLETQEGEPVTQEELKRIASEQARHLGLISTWGLKEYVRFVVTEVRRPGQPRLPPS